MSLTLLQRCCKKNQSTHTNNKKGPVRKVHVSKIEVVEMNVPIGATVIWRYRVCAYDVDCSVTATAQGAAGGDDTEAATFTRTVTVAAQVKVGRLQHTLLL